MKNILTYTKIVFILLASTLVADAQTASKPVTGAPYSAEGFTEMVRTLENGAKITNKYSIKYNRDGEGRTRTERLSSFDPSNFFSISSYQVRQGGEDVGRNYSVSTETITIVDPVAGFTFYVNPVNKTYRKIALPTGNPIATVTVRPPPKPATPANEPPSYKSETLSPRVIEGLDCTGNSFTSTIPPGKLNNDIAITSTSETWFSTQLKVIVLSLRNDPMSGKYTYTLKDIKLAEPDKSLFVVPEDYKLVTLDVNEFLNKKPE